MKPIKIACLAAAACVFIMILNQSCGPKRLAVHPAAEVERDAGEKPAAVAEEKKPEPRVEEKPVAAPVEKPNFNFKNIQFEHDSHVLKTDSYTILDQISREMLKDRHAKFIINGHASIEGAADYNMSLSIDRANAVRIYLVNSGIPAENLTTKGYGATQPTASNDTEAGRALNRRVEIKHVP